MENLKSAILVQRIIHLSVIVTLAMGYAFMYYLLHDNERTDSVNAYYAEYGVEIFSLVVIYLTARMMTFGFIKRQISGNLQAYQRWSFVRIFLSHTAMWSSLVTFIFFPGNNSVVWVFLMVLVSQIFIFPSESRALNEMGMDEYKKE